MEFWSKHSRKMFFSLLVVLLYVVVANPSTYNFVGSLELLVGLPGNQQDSCWSRQHINKQKTTANKETPTTNKKNTTTHKPQN